MLSRFFLFALASAAPAAAQGQVTETRCDVITGRVAGEIRTVRTPWLRVLEGTAAPGAFRPDLPEGASAIMCGRRSVLSAEHDDEVLALGVPLFISEVTSDGSGRLGSLEIVDGRFRFRLIEGELDAAEEALLQRRLNAFQTRSQASESSARSGVDQLP